MMCHVCHGVGGHNDKIISKIAERHKIVLVVYANAKELCMRLDSTGV